MLYFITTNKWNVSYDLTCLNRYDIEYLVETEKGFFLTDLSDESYIDLIEASLSIKNGLSIIFNNNTKLELYTELYKNSSKYILSCSHILKESLPSNSFIYREMFIRYINPLINKLYPGVIVNIYNPLGNKYKIIGDSNLLEYSDGDKPFSNVIVHLSENGYSSNFETNINFYYNENGSFCYKINGGDANVYGDSANLTMKTLVLIDSRLGLDREVSDIERSRYRGGVLSMLDLLDKISNDELIAMNATNLVQYIQRLICTCNPLEVHEVIGVIDKRLAECVGIVKEDAYKELDKNKIISSNFNPMSDMQLLLDDTGKNLEMMGITVESLSRIHPKAYILIEYINGLGRSFSSNLTSSYIKYVSSNPILGERLDYHELNSAFNDVKQFVRIAYQIYGTKLASTINEEKFIDDTARVLLLLLSAKNSKSRLDIKATSISDMIKEILIDDTDEDIVTLTVSSSENVEMDASKFRKLVERVYHVIFNADMYRMLDGGEIPNVVRLSSQPWVYPAYDAIMDRKDRIQKLLLDKGGYNFSIFDELDVLSTVVNSENKLRSCNINNTDLALKYLVNIPYYIEFDSFISNTFISHKCATPSAYNSLFKSKRRLNYPDFIRALDVLGEEKVLNILYENVATKSLPIDNAYDILEVLRGYGDISLRFIAVLECYLLVNEGEIFTPNTPDGFQHLVPNSTYDAVDIMRLKNNYLNVISYNSDTDLEAEIVETIDAHIKSLIDDSDINRLALSELPVNLPKSLEPYVDNLSSFFSNLATIITLKELNKHILVSVEIS